MLAIQSFSLRSVKMIMLRKKSSAAVGILAAGLVFLVSFWPLNIVVTAQEAAIPKAGGTDLYGDPLPQGAIVRLGTPRMCVSATFVLAFAPDSSQVATVSGLQVLQIWDVHTGREIRQWRVPEESASFARYSPLVYSPDGRYLALSCGDGSLRIWQAATGKEVFHKDQKVNTLTFSPDGKALAAAWGPEVRLWNPQSGEMVQQFSAGEVPIRQLAFSADGRTLVGLGHVPTVRGVLRCLHWDVTSGKEKSRRDFTFSTTIDYSCLSPDGRLLTLPAGKDNRLNLWDTAAGKIVATTQKQPLFPVRTIFADDGKTFLTLTWKGDLHTWDSATGRLLHQRKVDLGEINTVVLSPDKKMLALLIRQDHSLHLWDLNQGKEMHSFTGHRNGPLQVAFAPDGKTVLTTSIDSCHSSPPLSGESWSLRRWDVTTGKELQIWERPQATEVRQALFTPAGDFLAVVNTDGWLHLLDTEGGKERLRWQLPTQECTVEFSPKEIIKYAQLAAFDLGFSAAGDVLIAVGGGRIALWDRATGKVTRELTRPQQSSLRVGLFPDGRSLLLAEAFNFKSRLTQIDMATGAQLVEFPGLKNLVHGLSVSPGGHSVTAVDGQRLQLYEVLTGQKRWQHHLGSWANVLAFSPDGRLLATGSRDKVVCLWDAITGQPLQQWTGHNGPVSSLAFSPDGRWLVSGGGNIALVWDVQAVRQDKYPVLPALQVKELTQRWQDLGKASASEAALALSQLVQGDKTVAPFLLKQLLALPPVPTGQIPGWVKDLESSQFVVREKATQELQKLGRLAEPALQRALDSSTSAEATQRLRDLLAQCQDPPRDWLQAQRALEILELRGDAGARQTLERLAKEASESWLRQQAQQARQRLSKRS
jgi:WD40 repeat protein